MWRSFDLNQVENHFEWRMLKKLCNPVLSKRPDILFYSCFGNEHLKYNCLRVFYTPENIRPQFNRCDYAFSFDYPITKRNYRLPIYRRWPSYKQLFNQRNGENILLENREFCSILISNPNGNERNNFFNKLSHYKKVDSGGKHLNNIGQIIAPGEDNKLNWMKKYKFSIAFENSTYPGYTTEKLMHALISNTIPIYWGNPLAYLDFNPKAFINVHDYHSIKEVIERVKEIDNDQLLYLEYLNQPCLINNKETEFCKEDNILARFDEIITSKIYYVPKYKKFFQKPAYFLLKIKENLKSFYVRVMGSVKYRLSKLQDLISE